MSNDNSDNRARIYRSSAAYANQIVEVEARPLPGEGMIVSIHDENGKTMRVTLELEACWIIKSAARVALAGTDFDGLPQADAG